MAASKPESAADHAERSLIEGILNGTYPPGSELPGERILCKVLGVARPALREALQRLSRDGWLEIQHGKPTRVVDLTQGATLGILTGMLNVDPRFFGNFIPDVLVMWSQLAPDYTTRALTLNPQAVEDLVTPFPDIEDRPDQVVAAMWQTHRLLIELSGNIIYGLMYNSFSDFYRRLAIYYYQDGRKRAEAHAFFVAFLAAVTQRDITLAASLMRDSILGTHSYWQSLTVHVIAEDVIGGGV